MHDGGIHAGRRRLRLAEQHRALRGENDLPVLGGDAAGIGDRRRRAARHSRRRPSN